LPVLTVENVHVLFYNRTFLFMSMPMTNVNLYTAMTLSP